MSHPVAVIATAFAVAVVVGVGMDFLRPKGARILNRGKNGETALAFDPASIPAKK